MTTQDVGTGSKMCLICHNDVDLTSQWKNTKSCSCRPILHNECWKKWNTINGRCLICRDQPTIRRQQCYYFCVLLRICIEVFTMIFVIVILSYLCITKLLQN